jgi:flagellar hook-associated protein 2
MSSITPLAFTGISSYSEDFQAILDRQVRIASFPLKALQNQQSDVFTRRTLVGGIATAASTLEGSLRALGQLGERKGLTATSSNTAKVTATNVNAPAPVTYQISNITSIAAAANESTVTGYASADATAVSSTDAATFDFDGETYALNLAGRNNLQGLRAAINASGADVTASIFNTGSPTNPYYLSVSANNRGATNLGVLDGDGSTALLTSTNQGANTVFRLNGVEVTKPTTEIIDVVAGVTFSINGTTSGSEIITVELESSRDELRGALEDFISAYNALEDQLSQQIGEGAGLLSGDSLIRDTQSRLKSIAGFQGSSGSIRTLADLGVEFGRDGKAFLNDDTFDTLSSSQIQAAFDFLGSESTGFGGTIEEILSVSDPLFGSAKLQIDLYDESALSLEDSITSQTERINTLQSTLRLQLQNADALLATIESQKAIVDASIQSLQLTLFGKNKD